MRIAFSRSITSPREPKVIPVPHRSRIPCSTNRRNKPSNDGPPGEEIQQADREKIVKQDTSDKSLPVGRRRSRSLQGYFASQ